MFAESTALHAHAVEALSSPDRAYELLDFEQHLLDRQRKWACTGGRTLKERGYGHLGSYTRHVRGRINLTIHLDQHTCTDIALESFLVSQALLTGARHKGMPEWQLIVGRIGVLLADPNHQYWPDESRGSLAQCSMPDSVISVEDMQRALLVDPPGLPCDVLEWLSQFFLYCAGPPYRMVWDQPN